MRTKILSGGSTAFLLHTPPSVGRSTAFTLSTTSRLLEIWFAPAVYFGLAHFSCAAGGDFVSSDLIGRRNSSA